MHQGLAPGDADHGSAAFIHGLETLFRRKVLFQDVGRVLDLSTASAGKIAAEERLQHEDERVLLASGELLPQDISSHCPHLRNGNRHSEPSETLYRYDIAN
jgi:hypothetical protein